MGITVGGMPKINDHVEEKNWRYFRKKYGKNGAPWVFWIVVTGVFLAMPVRLFTRLKLGKDYISFWHGIGSILFIWFFFSLAPFEFRLDVYDPVKVFLLLYILLFAGAYFRKSSEVSYDNGISIFQVRKIKDKAAQGIPTSAYYLDGMIVVGLGLIDFFFINHHGNLGTVLIIGGTAFLYSEWQVNKAFKKRGVHQNNLKLSAQQEGHMTARNVAENISYVG